jgi:DNA-binding MarR family transcriptional regulator
MADTSLSEKKIGLLVWQTSNLWQNKLRKILKLHNITLNEYLVLESIIELQNNSILLTQNIISLFSGIDVSVISVVLKLLESKHLIKRSIDKDNRKKSIEMLINGKKLFNKIHPFINFEEKKIFDKLQNERTYFKNLLKLILGKKLRIKADKN